MFQHIQEKQATHVQKSLLSKNMQAIATLAFIVVLSAIYL